MIALVVGGLVLGGAGLSPAAWPLAWIGFALMAFGLALPTTLIRALLGLALCVGLTRGLWFAWSFSMAEAMVPTRPRSSSRSRSASSQS
ncbi:hypothetical protein [Nannocystis sp.]|uniref:hypothetical protein n=1 Tax=Nannocystis sp. TaxID=1962667 RepID=UPI0025F55F18|nr:hypothetical protein [Nannocystis sp.]MBK7823646.1 hypothetical protein [Nannocystis sp.]